MDTPVKSLNPNKHLKEQFVSNLSGSSMLELFSLTAVLSIVILLQRSFGFNSQTEALSKKDENDNGFLHTKNLAKYIATLSLDFLYIVVPFILYTTVLADWTYINTTIVALLVLLCILAGRFGSFFQEDGVQSHRQNISSYRVSTVLLTCLCILAVDFKIFPRRYAKTETYGTSLMDLGVGSFVLANSLVSRQARGISTLKITNSLRSTSPLIFLGFARLISTSSVDYQVHVGEYGVHWNFFFTLAGVTILTSIINVPPNYCGILGLLILLGYQVLLLLGLNEYLLSDKRGADLISQNKEGIFSIFGYWSLYLFGVQLGNFLFFENHANSSLRTNKWARIRVWVLSLLFWFLTYILDRHVERVSRRMCNLAYVTLVLAQNLQVLGIIMLSDYTPRHKLSALEEAFNQNLLASFLLANVLTGLVNLSVDTLFVSSVSALAILHLYAFVLSLAVGFAKFYGIKFKFW
ncbi:PREDICTED: uncharacterized protein At4g17910 isoform X2 [Ipomoea nil]|uniref:uncharacterized protein At4g17910 isoform X2 n=1 Tax=Ipomoea nil TaxID=35883 RepID=UPI0009009517|nr:PREDICTED: uncharacterized protein At4g17910 isoform X2 [Ipomoea nil]